MNLDNPKQINLASLIRPLGGFVAWIGASVGSLSVVLTVLGYLVESAYLSSLGLRRGMLELAPIEYMASGGQFLLGLIPLSFSGMLNFLLDYWWTVPLVIIAFHFGMWRKLGSTYRWVLCASVNMIWLAFVIPLLEKSVPGSDANKIISMMCFMATLSVIYAVTEQALASSKKSAKSTIIGQVLFYAVLSVTLLTLPYARGLKGLERELPNVQLTSKDVAAFCAIFTNTDSSTCTKRTWQLVQIGKEKSLLRDPMDGSIYIIPSSMIATLRINKEFLKP